MCVGTMSNALGVQLFGTKRNFVALKNRCDAIVLVSLVDTPIYSGHKIPLRAQI